MTICSRSDMRCESGVPGVSCQLSAGLSHLVSKSMQKEFWTEVLSRGLKSAFLTIFVINLPPRGGNYQTIMSIQSFN